MDLFTPIVSESQLHANFVRTLEPNAIGVRQVLTEWADGFVDRDNKFVREFQTTYNSCFWELYLHAVLKRLGLSINFTHDTPDFVVRNAPMAIEAAIASHAQGDTPEWEKTFEGTTDTNLMETYRRSIIRLSNAFMSKSTAYLTKYGQRPYMKDRSYVIAIGNYSTQDFNLLGDVPMQWLLYDIFEHKAMKKDNGAEIRLGLFNSDACTHVSAVMFSGLATFGKARALNHTDVELLFSAIRIKNNVEPIRIVQREKSYLESLTDGLRIFVNPYASHPIDLRLFSDEGIRKFVPDPLDESMVVTCHKDGDLCMRSVTRLTHPD
ncbi:hypothetical protein PY365_24420 [Roseiarcaceae bacterium H3SJ34-1]|uniref:hypothetical protein n=1 Tax=Terripilifer ovatus TaxID=3032367 RepID=UPI003AB9A7E3|nr:hypothetical protein [Roseiarcaceae bacterium H3SJ34-1]